MTDSPTNPTRDLASLLRLPEVEQYKADRRSRVWRVACDEGDRVIKQYRHNTLRQRAAWAVGVHPAQREARRARELAADGISVVPIERTAMLAGQGYVVTQQVGVSVQRAIEHGLLDDDGYRRAVMQQIVDVTAKLISRGWFFRDLQMANMVLANSVEDDRPRVLLIDTGSARRTQSTHHVTRMLGMLVRTARMEGAPWLTCLRGLLAVSTAVSSIDARDMAARIAQEADLWPLPDDWVPPRDRESSS